MRRRQGLPLWRSQGRLQGAKAGETRDSLDPGSNLQASAGSGQMLVDGPGRHQEPCADLSRGQAPSGQLQTFPLAKRQGLQGVERMGWR